MSVIGATGADGRQDFSSMQDRETMLAAEDMLLLLPWYATGKLASGLMRRIGDTSRRDGVLAGQLAGVRREQVEVVALNEGLGTPSERPLLMLFAAIDSDDRRLRKSCD